MADRNHGKPGGSRVCVCVCVCVCGKKCIGVHFEARGLKEILEPWHCVRAGGAGTFWNRGEAF